MTVLLFDRQGKKIAMVCTTVALEAEGATIH